MKKLNNKVFFTIFGLMAGALTIAVVISIIGDYIRTQDMLSNGIELFAMGDPRYLPPEINLFNLLSGVTPKGGNIYSDNIIEGFYTKITNTLIIYIVFVAAFFFISKLLTEWITRPVGESFEKQKEFIADASHELKTPLSVIIASSEAMKPSVKDKKHLENIKEESSRMSALITKLLDLASTEKTDESYFAEEDLSKIVKLSSLTFEARALEKDRKISINIQEDIKLKVNENDIKQLVEILLDNALEHSAPKSTININLQKGSKQIILEVINKGEGIAPGDEEKIFERFYRADKVRNQKEKRYGLGLAIAKNIVENHNGKISAKSQNGKTTFKVIL